MTSSPQPPLRENGPVQGLFSTALGSAQEALYKGVTTLLTILTIIWLAVFLYASFYYYYMPTAQHTRPVHLQYKSCGPLAKGLCSFPFANVTLTKRQQLLMVGQYYRVVVDLEMPESLANRQLGMFMVCGNLMDRDGTQFSSSCRSTMLRYKSTLHHIITTLFKSFFLVTGSLEEKQTLSVELFSSYEENPSRPATGVHIEVQSNHAEIYCATVVIQAHFTGLRYFMCNWPMLSALIGISTNAFFLSVLVLLSWSRLFSSNKETHCVSYDPKGLGAVRVSPSPGSEGSRTRKRRVKKSKAHLFKGLPRPKSRSSSESNSKSWDWEPMPKEFKEEKERKSDEEELDQNRLEEPQDLKPEEVDPSKDAEGNSEDLEDSKAEP